ncbi:type 11 methyltransferase [Mycolicibacterium tokaiense]|uniref:Type 11 methyltransferase n=1 Tax=Mycolicibacterium tokaiense TaxID=39695 RepID=A0A378TA37_9MYCO|nr:type 11 methyltransferase [Mycolicibacterium tokaiense]
MTATGDVPTAFDPGADSYDALVGANPGYNEHLRLSAQRMNLPNGGRGLRLLDAGCGTGLSTAALLAVAPEAEIVAVDGSAGMLAQARKKNWPDSVSFVHSYIERIAEAGVHGPFDGIFAAYLIRNVNDADAQLRAFRELLKPGGHLRCMNTRCATPGRPPHCGISWPPRSSSRPASSAPATPSCTGICAAA